MFPETIETDSLTLNPLREEYVDVFDLYDLFGEESDGVADVFEYVPQEPYASVKEARDQLIKAETAWEEAETAQYAVYTSDNNLAGYAVLSIEWERQTGNIGFILAKPYWGQGYAGECATALTELAFDQLDLELVAIGYEEGNERSKRAVEKFINTVGGQYDGVLRNWTPIGDEIADHHRYTVTQGQYQQTRHDK
ncbi:GNAT family N-acetyltransferase [Natronorubrum texcoconense]|uniref:Protein N-acetyltransferase, RimJ/RimL family n=1 Tax=Natronorubrum texcoconense TaxID=1095776 RepID=A0A1G9GW51_9EURY|nr:GNAT family N-acetyltransferase [Natronorubrum texcoconense]SDL04896.1 Protein N-acetyltransferase, RimJ/RimL family [Natronorubrum texcoconense]